MYGALIIDVSKALLVLNGMSGDIKISLSWQNPLPHQDLASAQYALAMKQLGVSATTLQREMGYDPEEELALNDAEDAIKLAKLQAQQAVLAPAVPASQTPPGQPKPAPTPATAQPAQGGQA